MALGTSNPSSNTNPDPSGGLAVTSASNTGHGSTTSTASGGTNSQTKSCRWTAFPAGASNPVSVTLKVDYLRNGTLSDGGVDTYNQLLIEYSINGGSGWNTLLNHEFVTSSSSGTASVALSKTQDLTQVQVRDSLTATKTGGLSATMVATISAIRLEVLTVDGGIVVMM